MDFWLYTNEFGHFMAPVWTPSCESCESCGMVPDGDTTMTPTRILILQGNNQR